MSKLLICAKNSGNTYTVCDYIQKKTDIDLKVVNDEKNFELEKYIKLDHVI